MGISLILQQFHACTQCILPIPAPLSCPLCTHSPTCPLPHSCLLFYVPLNPVNASDTRGFGSSTKHGHPTNSHTSPRKMLVTPLPQVAINCLAKGGTSWASFQSCWYVDWLGPVQVATAALGSWVWCPHPVHQTALLQILWFLESFLLLLRDMLSLGAIDTAVPFRT